MTTQYFLGKTIWLIGGSRGMGLALGKKLIQAGADVIISSRHAPDGIDKKTYRFAPLEVGDTVALKKLCQQLQPLDGVIFMPAVYDPGPIVAIKEDILLDMVKVNNIAPTLLAKYMAGPLEKRKGFLAICGSQAGNVGLPLGQPYSATKAYLKNFCESLQVEHPKLVVQLIAPGFVKTDLTSKNKFDMPFIMTTDEAADRIMKGLRQKKSIILFPKRLDWLLRCWAALPLAWQKFLWGRG